MTDKMNGSTTPICPECDVEMTNDSTEPDAYLCACSWRCPDCTLRLNQTRDDPDTTRPFKVIEFCDDVVWLKLQEGGKKGLQFAIPTAHPDYDAVLNNSIKELDEGTRLDASLVSENERDTKWRFTKISFSD